jgi:hypothetical protein
MRHCGLRYHITSLMMMTEMVLETSVSFIHLTRLTARDFIECCRRESFRSYTSFMPYLFDKNHHVKFGLKLNKLPVTPLLHRAQLVTFIKLYFLSGFLIYSNVI